MVSLTVGLLSFATTAIPALANLVTRFSADAITPQTDNTTLTSWTDSISSIVAGSTVGTGPKYRTNILNGKPSVRTSGGGLSIATPGALKTAVDSQQSTTFIVYQRTSGAATGGIDCLFGATTGGGSYFYTADGVNVGRYSILLPVATAVQNGFSTLGGTCDTTVPGSGATPGYETIGINGGIVYSQNLAPPTSGGNTFTIGTNNANNFPSSADIFEILVWNRALTPTEYMQAQKWACDKYAQPYPWAGQSKFLVFFGDSITQALGASTPANRYPNVAAASLSRPFGTWHNLGIGGLTLPQMGTMAATYITPMAALIGSTKLAVVAHEWANSRSAGDTSQGATYLAAIKSVANTLNVWGTSTSASGYDPSADRAAYNFAWDSLTPKTNVDAYWPIHTDTHIGVDSSYATFDAGGDGLHPTDDGNAHLASTAVTAIGLLP